MSGFQRLNRNKSKVSFVPPLGQCAAFMHPYDLFVGIVGFSVTFEQEEKRAEIRANVAYHPLRKFKLRHYPRAA